MAISGLEKDYLMLHINFITPRLSDLITVLLFLSSTELNNSIIIKLLQSLLPCPNIQKYNNVHFKYFDYEKLGIEELFKR